MRIVERKIKLKDLTAGFDIGKYSGSDEDVFCYNGKLNCRPAYQRNYVYDEKRKAEVINTILKGYEAKTQFPLNTMYWAKKAEGEYELLDGQQRTLSICLFRHGHTCKINGADVAYIGMDQAYKDWLNNYELTIYVCERDEDEEMSRFEKELQDWFQIINTGGMDLTDQEKKNAIYYGQWLSAAKILFSNEDSMIFRETYGVEDYIKINHAKMNRQEFLETMLKWISEHDDKTLDGYMSSHRNDEDAQPMFDYLMDVVDWIKKVFTKYNKEVLYGRDWGRLYNTYHDHEYDPDEVNALVEQLYADDEVEKKDGIVEYILSDKNEKYLNLRAFDQRTKKDTYNRQKGICPLCVNYNKTHPGQEVEVKHAMKDMEADHIYPWSLGGKTDPDNCCMLCKKHNREKSADLIPWIKEYMLELDK